MMNSLLKRQIRKYLPEHLKDSEELQEFLNAVDRSYVNLEDQVFMQKRATELSSNELSEANQKLQEEAESLRNLIKKLKSVIHTLNVHELEEDRTLENSNSLRLIDFIDAQTQEIIRINEQKDILVESLERQNQELNDYAHMVSHDLVSPLSNIETLTHLLEDDYGDLIDLKGLKKLNLISDNVHRIATLVGAIRDYSSIKKVSKENSDLDLHQLVDDTINEMNLCKSIQVNITDRLPSLKGERHSFKHLFLNLIQNAIKFNDKDNKKIEIGCNEDDEFWKFHIRDNGQGIDEPYLKKVFIAFFKLQNDPTSAGMGLSIVKKVIDLYQGEVWAESEVNEGATFHFTIKK